MPEYEQMLEIIKLAAVDAVGAAKPFALTYGVVKKAEPLTITVDQKLELGQTQLILTNAVRDHTVYLSVDDWTEAETEHTHNGAVPSCTHRHAYTGRKKCNVLLGLKTGERVLLLRIQGGQQYIVLDRAEMPS